MRSDSASSDIEDDIQKGRGGCGGGGGAETSCVTPTHHHTHAPLTPVLESPLQVDSSTETESPQHYNGSFQSPHTHDGSIEEIITAFNFESTALECALVTNPLSITRSLSPPPNSGHTTISLPSLSNTSPTGVHTRLSSSVRSWLLESGGSGSGGEGRGKERGGY